MLFNSLEFIFFLPVVFIIYWFVVNKKLGLQNLLIVIASYVFYGWWDWRFLGLIFFSSIVDFSLGIMMYKENKVARRKLYLALSILVNLGFLGFFKYYNFFLENFNSAFTFFGSPVSIQSLKIVLPVGISFYTFQTLSYSIDIYKRKLEPTKNLITFLAFVSFFPQLVAGPIERATHLLPQFYKKRVFNYSLAVSGMQQILWGLFKKVVIADNCAEYANIIFDNQGMYNGSTLFVGAILFTFQIYGDFSGYSDIAIGTSRLFGFDLMKNFNFPYFSRDIAEFWRRWHISLSTWFRDYLYIPLGGSRGSTTKKIRNTFIIFIVSGFWHGANWTFVVWGALNAFYFIPLLLTNNHKNNIGVVAQGSVLPNLKESFQMLRTFSLTVLAWIFFRSDNLTLALSYLKQILSFSFFTIPEVRPTKVLILVVLFVLIEWSGREKEFAIDRIQEKFSKPLVYVFFYFLIFLIFWYGGEEQQFIYFQF
jgi:D-alanyl-lipoteichoic acid acyltransferase DltB (MBOAT superfamily)